MYIIAFSLVLIVHSSIILNFMSATVFLEVYGLLPVKEEKRKVERCVD